MNTSLKLLFSRRSVRKYADRPIEDNLYTDLLEAAMAAPSAVAKDPWHFIVVRERSRLDEIAELLPSGKMLKEAAGAVIVCGEIARAHDGLESYMLQDCSAAIENILLAATALGLGSCWLGVHPRPERIEGIQKIFDLPEGIIPVSGISLGWPAKEPEARTRYRDEAVHWGGWGERSGAK